MSTKRSWALVLGVGAAVYLLAGWSAKASATPGYGTASLPTQIEAWYWTVGCTSPVGCGAVVPPSNPYPANTLHVGYTASQQIEASYFTLNTAALPAGSVITQATLYLPVATDSPAATLNASSAQIRICPTTQSFRSADFATSKPPATDCNIEAAAMYDPGSSEPYFTVNLAPLLKASRGSLTGVGIGVLPDSNQTSGSWQVSLNGRARHVPGQAPITAAVTYQPGRAVPAPAGLSPTPPARTPTSSASANLPTRLTNPFVPPATPTGAATPTLAPTQASGAPALGAGPSQQSQSPTERVSPAAVIRGGQYGMVWAVPLGLIALAWLIYTTATRDLRSYLR